VPLRAGRGLGDGARWPTLAGAADTDSLAPVPRPTPGSGASAARHRAYRAALTSSALVAVSPAPTAASVPAEGPPLATEEEHLLGLGDSVLRAAARSGGGGHVTADGALAPSPQAESHHRAFLDAAGDAKGATVIARVEPAGSPYTLRAGTVIPGLLLTEINSDLPGDVVAQVSRDVYDSRSQRTLLVPKGARLIGTYDNRVVAGEGRLLVAWTRLILPDGRSLRLPGLALKDPQGRTGATDQVDTHWHRVFGKALLLSAISAGVQLSQPQQATVFAPPSAGQVATGALGQELSNVALEVLRRGMDVAPTITIRQGQPFDVFLNGDLVFDGPYEEEQHAAP
jgi:type IV secretion system protein VirB10